MAAVMQSQTGLEVHAAGMGMHSYAVGGVPPSSKRIPGGSARHTSPGAQVLVPHAKGPASGHDGQTHVGEPVEEGLHVGTPQPQVGAAAPHVQLEGAGWQYQRP